MVFTWDNGIMFVRYGTRMFMYPKGTTMGTALAEVLS